MQFEQINLTYFCQIRKAFQFQQGTIWTYTKYRNIWLGEVSIPARYNLNRLYQTPAEVLSGFNSSKVQFELVVTGSFRHSNIVSIPARYNLNDDLSAYEKAKSLSFNSSKVQFEPSLFGWFSTVQHCFNSSKVQFEPNQAKDKLNSYRRFNSSKVQFEHALIYILPPYK